MASISFAQPWHPGEQRMHQMTNVPEYDNPTSYALTPQAAYMLQSAPLLAIGTLDSHFRPWVALWGGESGFARPLGGGVVGVRAGVDAAFDPVVEAFIPKDQRKEGDVVRSEGDGKIFAGLSIDLMTRKRVKIAGRMIAGAIGAKAEMGIGELQAAIKIDQSLGMFVLSILTFEAQANESRKLSQILESKRHSSSSCASGAEVYVTETLSRSIGIDWKSRLILHIKLPRKQRHGYQSSRRPTRFRQGDIKW
jgi:hypothetical protein